MRRVLAQSPWLRAPSSVTGREPTVRAMAYILWARATYTPWSFGRRTPPPLAGGSDDDARRELERVRADAVRVVRQTLLGRAREQQQRQRAGQVVYGLRLRQRGPQPTVARVMVPTVGDRPGLPGTYCELYPTLVDPRWLDRARRAAAGGRIELVELAEPDLAAAIARLKVAGDPLLTPLSRPRLDHAALAEQVARRYPRSGVDGTAARRAERHMERVLAEAQAWEYRHPGREGLTGRQPLP